MRGRRKWAPRALDSARDRPVSSQTVSAWTPSRAGAVAGALLALIWVVWTRVREAPCPGAVTVEFHPPLPSPGQYRFWLGLPDRPPCEFEVTLPGAERKTSAGCGLARELKTVVRGRETSLVALNFGAAPDRFELRIRRGRELVYDVTLSPKYAPYPTLRTENRRLCGDRARVVPACLRGSSACAPFPARCTGPAECGPGQSCCLTPEWGLEFGVTAASECQSSRDCLAHFGHIGCHSDADCSADQRCQATALARDYTPRVLTCQNR